MEDISLICRISVGSGWLLIPSFTITSWYRIKKSYTKIHISSGFMGRNLNNQISKSKNMIIEHKKYINSLLFKVSSYHYYLRYLCRIFDILNFTQNHDIGFKNHVGK